MASSALMFCGSNDSPHQVTYNYILTFVLLLPLGVALLGSLGESVEVTWNF